MNSLYATSVTDSPAPFPPVLNPSNMNTKEACNPSTLFKYQKDLQAWNACQMCGRSGYGTIKHSDGTFSCDTTSQKAGALASCPAGPVNPCYPMAVPLSSTNPWALQEPHSWGSSVYDPKYGTHILWGTWDAEHGRPYFSKDAPYMRGGLC